VKNVRFIFLIIVHPKWFDRLKRFFRHLAILLYNAAINLNIFSVRDFGSHVDRTTAKRLGQWTTRLYIVVLIICLTIFALHNFVQPQALTKTFDNPPLSLYNRLIKNYGDKLECSCSFVAPTYGQFVNIEPVFHEVRRK